MSVAAPLSARDTGALRTAGQSLMQTPRPKNPLLTKDGVGKAKPSCYDLPEEQFAFGRPGNMDNEGAREVSMRWVCHRPSRGPDFEPDFVHNNRQAAVAKITTAKDMKHYRKDVDLASTPRGGGEGARARAVSSPSGGMKDIVPSDVIPGYTYGRKVRPSTPIHEVISNRFGERSEQELTNFYTSFRELQERSKTDVRKIPLTTASRGHASRAKKSVQQQEEAKTPFKCRRFQRVGPKIENTHRRIGRAVLDEEDGGGPAPREASSAGGSNVGTAEAGFQYEAPARRTSGGGSSRLSSGGGDQAATYEPQYEGTLSEVSDGDNGSFA